MLVAVFPGATTLQCSPAFGQASDANHWDLGQATSDADISPDDRLLAITIESPSVPHGAQITESLEVWDYRQHVKTSSTQLATYWKMGAMPNAVRFSADGLLLVATDPTKLHVLEASTLKLIRTIEPPLGQESGITILETSPKGHLAIVGATNGVLFAYDLDTGSLLFQWKSSRQVRSISWKPDGTQFAVASPFLCTRFRDTLHVFGTNPWQHLQTLAARNPSAVTFSEGRLYVVESSYCKGSVFDRHLGLEAFDIGSWNRRKTVFLPGKDIHGSVSFANGRLLANTGDVKTEHDWLDGTTWGVDQNVQFTVWRGDVSSVEFTSPPFAIPPRQRFNLKGGRLSRTGKMVLLDPQHPQIFQIPQPSKN